MNRKVLEIIRSNPHIYNFLREESFHYEYLLQNPEYIKVIDKLAKEKYKITFFDKMDRLSDNLTLIKTFLDVIE